MAKIYNPEILQARGVGLSFGGRAILANLDLTIKKNEIVILIGPSGVGKSSFLKVLAGLEAKQSGRIKIFGEKLDKPHPKAAFVFQQAALLPWLNVERNVAYGLDFKCQPSISKAEITERVSKALFEVGLTHAAKKYPSALSGGMAQRAALARALAREPELLLLDEPLGALDLNTRQDMQKLLRRTIKRHQAAALMVTHNIDEAMAVGDRIILLGGHPAGIAAEWQLDDTLRDDLDKQKELRYAIFLALQKACAPVAPEESRELKRLPTNESVSAA